MSNHHLFDVLEQNRRDEQQRALRALLARPMLLHTHPAYPLVRKHADTLRQWLNRETGWALIIEDDFARLSKRVADHSDTTRPARLSKPSGAPPFSRRRYALTCLALAELERGEAQITLGRLGEAICQGAADPSLKTQGLQFSLEERSERRDLVAVVRLLLELGVLNRVTGDEDSFVHAQQDVLYDVNRRLLSSLLVASRGPSLVGHELDEETPSLSQRIAAITATFVPDTLDARNTALRRRLTARLLDDPLLYWDELSEEELAYLTSQRPHIARRIREATGLMDEVRAEGMAMVDPTGDLSDECLPSEGTEGHATLLLADYLAAQRTLQPLETLHQQMRRWIDEYRRYWKKSVRENGAEVELCHSALQRLKALRLVEISSDGVQALPAIGRHVLGETTIVGKQKTS
ncbi:MAG: TIGR02678 family protein [Thiotrichaceae bacterium]|nr:TIGR02678 family protein [Thiotrichaceae bacterium]